MPIFSLLVLCLFWVACSRNACADPLPNLPPRIWSGVVLATNGPNPGVPPEPLRRYSEKLKHIFGYNHFELVGESTGKMYDPNERWLVPSKDFSLNIRDRDEQGHRYTRIAVFQNRRRLAEFEAHLGPESPLFIRGPYYGKGQLFIVVHGGMPYEPVPRPMPPMMTGNPVPVTIIVSKPLKDRERMNQGEITINPYLKERLNTIPSTHFGPTPPSHFGPMDERGRIDSKFDRP